MKKIVSLLMVLAMLAAMVVVPVYADGTMTNSVSVPATVQAGETLTVTATLASTDNLLSADFYLSYPTAQLTYSSVEFGSTMATGWTVYANSVSDAVRVFVTEDNCTAAVASLSVKVNFTVKSDAVAGTALNFAMTGVHGSDGSLGYLTGTDANCASAVAAAAPSITTYTVGTGGKYSNLRTAFTAAPTNGTPVCYQLISNVTDNGRTTINAGSDITLDLNGYTATYSSTSTRANIYLNGDLTIKGNGSLVNASTTGSGHVIAMNEGSVLNIEGGNLTAGGKTGMVIYNNAGYIESISGGVLTAAGAECIYSIGNIGSISGGSFNGTKGLALYSATVNSTNYHARVTSITGGTFTGTVNGIFVKSYSEIGSISDATIVANGKGSSAIYNGGDIGDIDGATITTNGGNTVLTNAGGTVGEITDTDMTLVSGTNGAGYAVYNVVGTIESIGAGSTITANTVGIFNKGATINSVAATIDVHYGYGLYNNSAASVGTVNATITAANRATLRNTFNSTITEVTGGTYTTTGVDVDKCMAISNQTGSVIGTISGGSFTSYSYTIANNGTKATGVTKNAEIASITGGTFTSTNYYAVLNSKAGIIASISGGNFVGKVRGISNQAVISSISGGTFVATDTPTNSGRAIYTASGATTTYATGMKLTLNKTLNVFEVK